MGILIEADFVSFRRKRQCLHLLRGCLLKPSVSSLVLSYLSELRDCLSEDDLRRVDPQGLIMAAELTARIITDCRQEPMTPTFCYLHLAMEDEIRRLSNNLRQLNAASISGDSDDRIRFALALAAVTDLSSEELFEFFKGLAETSPQLQRMAIYKLGQFQHRSIVELIEPCFKSDSDEIRIEAASAALRLLAGRRGKNRFFVAQS